MNIEDLARPLGLTASLDFRRKQGEPMTKPEQDAWNAVAELSRLVRNQALEEAAQTVEAQDTYGTSSPAAIRALKE